MSDKDGMAVIGAAIAMADAANQRDALRMAQSRAAAEMAADASVAEQYALNAMKQVREQNELMVDMANTIKILHGQREMMHDAVDAGVLLDLRLKADDVGMRTLIRQLLTAIKRSDENNPLLDRKNRDHIFGLAYGEAYEDKPDGVFASQSAANAGLSAVITAADRELKRLDPGSSLCDDDEKYVIYWSAFEDEMSRQLSSLVGFEARHARITDPTYNREALLNSPYYRMRDNQLIQGEVKKRKGMRL